MNTKISFGILGLALLLIVVATIHYRMVSAPEPMVKLEPINELSYSCDAGKSIRANFHEGETKPPMKAGGPPIPGGSVDIQLSDGRTMNLHQTISADGVRYANPDESFVFWTKGTDVMVLEGDQPSKTYTNCTETTATP